jgi:hypothetical protein
LTPPLPPWKIPPILSIFLFNPSLSIYVNSLVRIDFGRPDGAAVRSRNVKIRLVLDVKNKHFSPQKFFSRRKEYKIQQKMIFFFIYKIYDVILKRIRLPKCSCSASTKLVKHVLCVLYCNIS